MRTAFSEWTFSTSASSGKHAALRWSFFSPRVGFVNLHSAPRLAAALAYYAILSLAPLLLFLVALSAVPFGSRVAQSDTVDAVRRMAGGQAAAVAATLLAVPGSSSPPRLIASIFGGLIMLFGASGVFAELRSSLNIIWDVKEQQSTWYREIINERLLSFAMVVALGLLIMLFLGASIAVAVFARFLRWMPATPHLLKAADVLFTFVLTSAVFSLVYRYVPAIRITWKDAWVGALVTAALFDVARIPLDLYLSHVGVGSAYGAAGSLVAFLFWVYCCAQIFYFGAEFTRVYSERFGCLSHLPRA